ncbi:hypothetical protein PHPALM_30057, partial [Phytophthora palmivora]
PPGELLTRLGRAGIDLCPPLELSNEGSNRDVKQASTRVGFVTKRKILEDRVIDEIASVVAGFEVTDGNENAVWGRTNGGAAMRWPGAIGNSKQIVFSVKEMSWPYMTDEYESTQQQVREDEVINSATSATRVLVLAEVDDEASGGVKFRLDRKRNDADSLSTTTALCEGGNETIDEDEDIYDTHVHLRRALDEISSPDARDRMDNSHVLFELTLQKMLRLLRLLSYSQPPPLGDHLNSDEERAKAVSATTKTPEPIIKTQEEPQSGILGLEEGEASAVMIPT